MSPLRSLAAISSRIFLQLNKEFLVSKLVEFSDLAE